MLNGDEPGHRTNGDKRWLWALVAAQFVVYRIATTRGADVLVALLGDVFPGVLCSDRWRPYQTYHQGPLQFCWAHVKRNLLSAQGLAKTTEASRFCRDALATPGPIVSLVVSVSCGSDCPRTPAHAGRVDRQGPPVGAPVFCARPAASGQPDRDVRNLATALFAHHEKFFVFVHHEGVEPTNNAAELALRTAVQWRKIMFGTRSGNGETRRRPSVDRHSHVPHATGQHLGLSHRRNSGPSSSSGSHVITAQSPEGLNCYGKSNSLGSLRPSVKTWRCKLSTL